MKESERIEQYNRGEIPEGTKMVITVRNVPQPQIVLKQAKEIMQAVSQFAYTDRWPDDEQWKTILPKWFVESMILKSSEDRDKDDNLWHFESWVESMYHRAWEWWSSKIEGDTITITLQTLNLPYVFEQFLYIFYSQGVPMEKIIVHDDIYG